MNADEIVKLIENRIEFEMDQAGAQYGFYKDEKDRKAKLMWKNSSMEHVKTAATLRLLLKEINGESL